MSGKDRNETISHELDNLERLAKLEAEMFSSMLITVLKRMYWLGVEAGIDRVNRGLVEEEQPHVEEKGNGEEEHVSSAYNGNGDGME